MKQDMRIAVAFVPLLVIGALSLVAYGAAVVARWLAEALDRALDKLTDWAMGDDEWEL